MTKAVNASQDREFQDDKLNIVSGGDLFGVSAHFKTLTDALSSAQKAIGQALNQASRNGQSALQENFDLAWSPRYVPAIAAIKANCQRRLRPQRCDTWHIFYQRGALARMRGHFATPAGPPCLDTCR
jgi:hypothetical protein